MKTILILLFLVACNGSQKGAFQKLDIGDNGGDTGQTLLPVEITTVTPTQTRTVLTQTSSMVFGVSVASGAGEVSYEFSMDGTVLQTGASPFYVLAGTSLPAGDYELVVTARNAISSDAHTFDIRKNSPASVVTFSPALLGQSLNCGSGSITFSGVMVDPNNDPFTISWELDGSPVTNMTPFSSVTTTMPFSQLVYAPDCTQSGSHTLVLKIYDGYEVTTKTWSFTVNNPPPPPGVVAIQTFTPTTDPTVLTNTSTVTFAVTVNDPTNVTYEFILDNSATLQTGTNSFYALAGSTLTPGYHSLKVRASNGTSTAEKIFNLRKNTAPAILTFTPAVLGASAACASGSITFDAAFTDNDGDTLVKTWELDNVTVTPVTAFTTVTNTASTAQLVYAPDCTKAGSHTLKLTVDDSHETVTKTWTFSISNPPPPPGNVQIVTFTPSVEPVVMTNASSTTFAVSIAPGAGVVTYEFKKDFTTVLQSSQTPFIVLSGSSLSPGVHTLGVKGTNSVSNDEKVFTIRKNTPPAVLSYTPALNGSVLNCGQDTLTFNSVMNDVDNDSLTKTWELDSAPVSGATPFTVITDGPASSQLAYSPDCTRTGVHTVSLKLFDGYETTTTSWSFTVNNPAVESITSYFPTSNAVTYLSTDVSKTFNAAGTGVGALTFRWKLDGTIVQTDANVTTSNFPLAASSLTIGDHTLEVILTDSTTSNDPPAPVSRSWTLYRNMKPRFLSVSPSSSKLLNLNSSISLTASIEDTNDTFTSVLVRGSTTCTPNGSNASAACGLTGMTLPSSTGTFVSLFSPGSTFLGENNFQLRVTDSHGESITQDFLITANYFSSACNSLSSGQICTLVGLPGLGSGLSVATEGNKIRLSPAWMTQDDQNNWFFSDHNTNTVWYYNTKATTATIFGLTVQPYSLQVVAGTGIAGTGGNGINARSFAMNFGSWGGALAWDVRDQALYITDYGNSRVVRVSNTGRANSICGLGSLTAQGSNANNTECLNPVDVEIDNTNRRLFITTQSRHVIKYIDITNTDITQWVSYVLAGANNTAGAVTGSTNMTGWGATTAGATRLNQPWGLYLDTADQILYFTEYGSCRARALGLPGSTTKTVSSQTITANNSFFLTSGAACASEAINTDVAVASTRFNRPMDIVLEKSGSTINGYYVTDYGGNRVSFCNNSAATPVTIGNQTIGAQMCNNVLGNGSATASTIPLNGKNISISQPLGLVKSSNTLYVGDRGYNLIRTMPVNVSNGTVTTFLGGVGRASYSGNAPLDSKLVTFNNPMNLMYRNSNKTLYVSDTSNAIIRSVNLQDGRVEDFAGGIFGNENRTNTTATSTNMISPKGMAMYDDFFLYADNTNNCFIRAYNSHATNDLIFGTLVNSNRTSPVAGYYNNCGAFVGGSAISTTDPNAKLQNPYSIGVDEAADRMYVSSRDAHCILRVNDNGTMQPLIGVCGTVAASPVYGDVYNSANLKLRFPGEIFMDPANPGNFFFTDFTDQATAHVKYANLTVSAGVRISGTLVALNNVETVYAAAASPGFIRSVAAFDTMVCFTSGVNATSGTNTVNCYNREDPDTTTLIRFGVAGTGAIQQREEQEGISAVSATFAVPIGLAFDGNGNLYVSEQGSHVIRMIKKWW